MNTLLAALVALAVQASPQTTISFDDALAQKKITATALANKNSAHYQQPVLMEVKNSTASPFSVELPVGRLFQSSDTTDQNFVSTEPVLFTLGPGESKKIPVSAMCINHHKSAPSEGQAYSIKKTTDGKLFKVAQFVANNKLSGTYLGQTAMWCISDNEPLEHIFGYDDTQVMATAKFLAGLTGKPVPPPPAADDYLRNPRARPRVSAGGEFNFRFSSPKAIHVAMFDSRNIAIRELYNNPNEPAGERNVKFEFDASVYNESPYYIRFLVDNRIMMEQEISF